MSSVGAVSSAGTTSESAPATPSEPDDLTRVEGIGPKIQELLNDAGIATFADLAGAPPDQLRGALDAGGSRFRMHDPGSWPEQAALAAAGRWDEFEELQDRLSGGR